jgi:catechol 2,3-dioxygenase-like lactoylglutathione lyase family enzyme
MRMPECSVRAGVCASRQCGFGKNAGLQLVNSPLQDRDTLPAMNARVARIDHIQIAAPAGCESAAREFYGSILGLKELEKPPALRVRGGCWFQCGSQQVHIGVEKDFQPARKAHPAFAVVDLDELRETLTARGVPLVDDDNIPGARRFFAKDPWGNRIEFVEIPA